MEENEINELLDKSTENINEAGGVAWTEMYGLFADKNGDVQHVKINLTSRSVNAALALAGLIEAIGFADEQYNLTPYPQNKVSKPNSPTAPVAKSDDFDDKAVDKAYPPVAQPVTEKKAEKATGEEFSFIAERMVVTPRPDGKANVEFFSTGHKYPDLKAVLIPEQAVGMMKHLANWTTEHFMNVGNFNVNYRVVWKNSKTLNSAGNPYKNITYIALADE